MSTLYFTPFTVLYVYPCLSADAVMLTLWFLRPTRTVIVSPTLRLVDGCAGVVDLAGVGVADVVEEVGFPALLTLLDDDVDCVVLVGCCVGAVGIVGCVVLGVGGLAGVDLAVGVEVLGVADAACILAFWFTGVKRSVLIVNPRDAAYNSLFSTDKGI